LLKNLEGCTVLVLDVYSQVTCSGLQGCRVFIGPTAGSVLLRDLVNCHVTLAGKQIRIRSSHSCTLAVHTPSPPVIEDSSDLLFLPFNGVFPGIDASFLQAGLQPTNNEWASVHDFTPAEGSAAPNWRKIDTSAWAGEDGGISPAAQLALAYVFDKFDKDGDAAWGPADFNAYTEAAGEEAAEEGELQPLFTAVAEAAASGGATGWSPAAPKWAGQASSCLSLDGARLTYWGLLSLITIQGGAQAAQALCASLGLDSSRALTDWVVREQWLALAAPEEQQQAPTASTEGELHQKGDSAGQDSGSAGGGVMKGGPFTPAGGAASGPPVDTPDGFRDTPTGSSLPPRSASKLRLPPQFASPMSVWSGMGSPRGPRVPSEGADDDFTEGGEEDESGYSQAATDALLEAMAAELPLELCSAVLAYCAATSPLPLPQNDPAAVGAFAAYTLARMVSAAGTTGTAAEEAVVASDLLSTLQQMTVAPLSVPATGGAAAVFFSISRESGEQLVRLLCDGTTSDRAGPAEVGAMVSVHLLCTLLRIRLVALLQGGAEAAEGGVLPVSQPGLPNGTHWSTLLQCSFAPAGGASDSEGSPMARAASRFQRSMDRGGGADLSDSDNSEYAPGDSSAASDTGSYDGEDEGEGSVTSGDAVVAQQAVAAAQPPVRRRLAPVASPQGSSGVTSPGDSRATSRSASVAVSAVMSLSPVPSKYSDAYSAEAFADEAAAVVAPRPGGAPLEGAGSPDSKRYAKRSVRGSLSPEQVHEHVASMAPPHTLHRDPVSMADDVIAACMAVVRRAPDVFSRLRQGVLSAPSVPASRLRPLGLEELEQDEEHDEGTGRNAANDSKQSAPVPAEQVFRSALPQRSRVPSSATASGSGPVAGESSRKPRRAAQRPTGEKSSHGARVAQMLGVDLIGAHSWGELLRAHVDSSIPDSLAVIVLLRLGGAPACRTLTERSGYPSFMTAAGADEWVSPSAAAASATGTEGASTALQGPTLTTHFVSTAVLPRDKLLGALQRMKVGPNATPQARWAASKRREASVALSVAAQHFEAALDGDVPSEAEVASGKAAWCTPARVGQIVKRFNFLQDDVIHAEAVMRASAYGATGAARTAARRLLLHAERDALSSLEVAMVQRTFGAGGSGSAVQGAAPPASGEDGSASAYTAEFEGSDAAAGPGGSAASRVRSLRDALAVIVASRASEEEDKLRNEPEQAEQLFWSYVQDVRSGKWMGGDFDAWAHDRAEQREARRAAVRDWGERKAAEAARSAAELSQVALLPAVIERIEALVAEDMSPQRMQSGHEESHPSRHGMQVHARLAELRKVAARHAAQLAARAPPISPGSPQVEGKATLGASARLDPLYRPAGGQAVAPLVTRGDVERLLRPVLFSLLADKRTAPTARALFDAYGSAQRRVAALCASKGGRQRIAALAQEAGCSWDERECDEEHAEEEGGEVQVPPAVCAAALGLVYQRMTREVFDLGALDKEEAAAAASAAAAAAEADRQAAFDEFVAKKREAERAAAAAAKQAKEEAEQEAERKKKASEEAYQQWLQAARQGKYLTQRGGGGMASRPEAAKPSKKFPGETEDRTAHAEQHHKQAVRAGSHPRPGTSVSSKLPTRSTHAQGVAGGLHADERPEWRDVAQEWMQEKAKQEQAAVEARVARTRSKRNSVPTGVAPKRKPGARGGASGGSRSGRAGSRSVAHATSRPAAPAGQTRKPRAAVAVAGQAASGSRRAAAAKQPKVAASAGGVRGSVKQSSAQRSAVATARHHKHAEGHEHPAVEKVSAAVRSAAARPKRKVIKRKGGKGGKTAARRKKGAGASVPTPAPMQGSMFWEMPGGSALPPPISSSWTPPMGPDGGSLPAGGYVPVVDSMGNTVWVDATHHAAGQQGAATAYSDAGYDAGVGMGAAVWGGSGVQAQQATAVPPPVNQRRLSGAYDQGQVVPPPAPLGVPAAVAHASMPWVSQVDAATGTLRGDGFGGVGGGSPSSEMGETYSYSSGMSYMAGSMPPAPPGVSYAHVPPTEAAQGWGMYPPSMQPGPGVPSMHVHGRIGAAAARRLDGI